MEGCVWCRLHQPKKAYLFDIIEGGSRLFDHGLREILESDKILKVFHDCRLDSDALFHEHKVKMVKVFDTQIGYAVIERQLKSSTPLPIGLNALLKRYGKGATNEHKETAKLGMESDPEYWLKRPLDEIQLEYARQDVLYLVNAYLQMISLLPSSARSIALKYSDKYLAQYRDAAEAVKYRSKPKEKEKEKENSTTTETTITIEDNSSSEGKNEGEEEKEEKEEVVTTTSESESEKKKSDKKENKKKGAKVIEKEETQRFIPKYGIKEWDMDVMASLLRREGRSRHKR